MAENIDKKEVHKLFRETRIFADLSDEELDSIEAISHEETFEAGDVLFDEGETPDRLFVIVEGKVAIEISVRFGAQLRRSATIDVANRGNLVGWSAVAGAKGYTGAGRCVERTKALVIDGERLRDLFAEDSDLGYRVMRRVVGLVRYRGASTAETLARILSILSHDLKAPLHAVQSYHQVMLGGYAGPIEEKQKHMLERSGERIIGLLGLIDDLLDMSRIERVHLDKEPVSLDQVAETSLENVRPQASDKEISLISDWPENLATVLGQSARLQQVFTNLLSNAVKFTPKGGEVKLRLRDGVDRIVIEVMDTGPGIAKDELPKVFDDFFRGSDAQSGGIGLGLSIAKRIVEAHGGKIWVESPYPGSVQGAKFVVNLPKK